MRYFGKGKLGFYEYNEAGQKFGNCLKIRKLEEYIFALDIFKNGYIFVIQVKQRYTRRFYKLKE